MIQRFKNTHTSEAFEINGRKQRHAVIVLPIHDHEYTRDEVTFACIQRLDDATNRWLIDESTMTQNDNQLARIMTMDTQRIINELARKARA